MKARRATKAARVMEVEQPEEWITLEEAVGRLSARLNRPVYEVELLRLALEERLELSLHFSSPPRMWSFEEAWLDEPDDVQIVHPTAHRPVDINSYQERKSDYLFPRNLLFSAARAVSSLQSSRSGLPRSIVRRLRRTARSFSRGFRSQPGFSLMTVESRTRSSTHPSS